MSDQFLDDVRREMEGVGKSLVQIGGAADFSISDVDGGLCLAVRRKADGRRATVEITGTTESFIFDVDNRYRVTRTAYDDESKWEVLREFFELTSSFVGSDYFEEVGERNGRTVSSVLHLTVPGGQYSISESYGLSGVIGKLLGCRKSVVRPPSE